MKPFISYALLTICISLLSCKKDDTKPVEKYEIVFKKDGVSDTLPTYYSSIQKNLTISDRTDFFLTGQSKDFTISFSMSVQTPSPFTTGTYETTINNVTYPVIADYFVNLGQPDEKDYTIANAPGRPNCHFSITITSIANKVVKGTFTGNYLYDEKYDEVILINEGEFTAKLH